MLRFANGHANWENIAYGSHSVRVIRHFEPTGLRYAVYRPVLCLVLQGTKLFNTGNQIYEVSAGRSLIVSVDMPIVSHISHASRNEPFLGLALDLDIPLIRDMAGPMEDCQEAASESDPAALVGDIEPALLVCAERAVEMLEQPDEAAKLMPGVLKDIHRWLVAGPRGHAVTRQALPSSHTQRVAKAIDVLRTQFAETLPIERLAMTAGMSQSTFHQHFKAITSLSPLQYQKQIRLLEARRLMVSDGISASRAAFAVGYESVPQFTREYGRLFGAPPRRDAQESRMRA
jgi:AraC-like DNA-binding protein